MRFLPHELLGPPPRGFMVTDRDLYDWWNERQALLGRFVDTAPRAPEDSPYVGPHGGLTCVNGHAMDDGYSECPCCGAYRPSGVILAPGSASRKDGAR